ncbi:Probable polyol transporter 6, partial [Linum grandiflorum]
DLDVSAGPGRASEHAFVQHDRCYRSIDCDGDVSGDFGTAWGGGGGAKLAWALGLSIASTDTFVVFFNIGLAPVTWIYSSEIFPLRLRAQGYSIGVAVNRLMNATIAMTFISLYKAITIGGAFLFFVGILAIGWHFFYFMFPEAKERTLEEIEQLFGNRFGSSSKSNQVEATL